MAAQGVRALQIETVCEQVKQCMEDKVLINTQFKWEEDWMNGSQDMLRTHTLTD